MDWLPRHSYIIFFYFVISYIRVSVAVPFEISTEISTETSTEISTEIISTDNFSINKDDQMSVRLQVLENKLLEIENALETLSDEMKCSSGKQFQTETKSTILRNIVRSLRNGQFNVTKELLEQNTDKSQIADIVYQIVLTEKIDTASARILEFVRGLSNANLSYIVLKSLWNEVRISGLINPNNLIALLVQFEALPPELSDTHQENRSAIIDDMQRMLSARTHDTILAYLKKPTSIPSEGLLSLGESFKNHNTEEKFHQIVGNAVNVAFDTVDPKDILNNIEELSNSSIPDKTLAITALNALFWKAKEKNLLTDQLTIDIMKKLDVDIDKTSQFTANESQKVLESIPSCLRNLVHKKSVRIRNVGTNENIYYYEFLDDSTTTWITEELSTLWDVEMVEMNVIFNSDSVYLSHSTADLFYEIIYLSASNYETMFTIQTHGQYCSIRMTSENKYMFASGIHWPADDRYSLVFFGKHEDPFKDPRYLWEIC